MALAFIAFITLFSLDVFNGYSSLPTMLAAFVMHSVPAMLLAATLWLLRKRPVLLGESYAVISVVFAIHFDSYRTLALMSLPVFLLLTGILFIVFGKRSAST
jgi:hypothetical protein